MEFPVKDTKFSGLFRKYNDTGTPKLKLIPSSVSWQWYPYYIFWYDQNHYHFCSGAEGNLVIKIVDFLFKITHYELRSHQSSEHYMRAWTFEGSSDNVHYDMLDNRPENDDLNCSSVKLYEVKKQRKSYRYFRIKQIGKTLSGNAAMRVSGLDIYGTLVPIKCSQQRKQLSYFFMYITCLILK